MGDVAPYPDRRGPVRHRQHFQLPQTHLPVHRQLPPRAPADLIGEDAARHPQVSLHLLFGTNFSMLHAYFAQISCFYHQHFNMFFSQ